VARDSFELHQMNLALADGIFWLAAVTCVIAEIAVLRSTYAARKVQKSALVPAANRTGEVAWAVIPAVALAVLLVVTWQHVRVRDAHFRMMDHSGMQMSDMPSNAPHR
jgi:heme/copper-type cytochrome/quinol oxidase subunit 2